MGNLNYRSAVDALIGVWRGFMTTETTHDKLRLYLLDQLGVNGVGKSTYDLFREWLEAGGASGGSTIKTARVRFETGDINTLPNTGDVWTLLDQTTTDPFTCSIAAIDGDEIEVGLNALIFPASTSRLELATIIGGNPVTYFSTEDGDPPDGNPGLYHDTSYTPSRSPQSINVTSGDLSGGQVTVGIVVKTTATAGILHCSENYPVNIYLKNYGQ